MGRILPVAACVALFALACACTTADQTKAKQEAHDLGRKIDHAVNSGGPAPSAEEKLRRGSEDLKLAGEKAGVKLDRAALTAKLKAKLVADVGLSTATSIEVDTRGDVVTLRGTVSSEEQKEQAGATARQLDGVGKVVNELTVRP